MTGPRVAGAPEAPPPASSRPRAGDRAAADFPATSAAGTAGATGAAAARDDAADDAAKDDGPARDAAPEAAAAKDDGAKTGAADAYASATEASDAQAHEPAVPDDVATGLEELPPGFWDEPPAAAPARVNRTRPDQEPRSAPTASAGPEPGATRETARDGGSGSRERGAAPHGDLERALLGGETTADELPEALRDTVDALRELFPGELLAVTPRADEDEGAMEAAEDDAGRRDDGDGEDGDVHGAGDPTHERTDAG